MITRFGRWVSAAAIIAVLGVAFSEMRLPAGWLIAGMLGAATVALVSRRELNPPAKAMSAAQSVIGVVAVEPLTRLTGSDLVHFAGCAAFSVSITLGLSVVFGIVLARFAKDLGLATANLSLIAGGASTISCMARELGADERYVALSQYLRLTIVVLTMPLVLSQLGTADPTPRLVLAQDHWSWVGLLVLVVVIYAGARLARLARMPAPFLLGPLVVGAVVAIADPSLARLMDPTAVVTGVAYVVIGWQAGGGFAVDVLRRFIKLIPLTLMFIALTIGSCFAVAVAVSEWTGVSLADAYLATTPGGIYGVLAIANEVHSGPIVVTLQVLRLVTMVLAAGMIPRIIGALQRRQAPATEPMVVESRSLSTAAVS
ncbi:MAG TPA: AbrB family transcriptional regulator [Mycobacterium sp.]